MNMKYFAIAMLIIGTMSLLTNAAITIKTKDPNKRYKYIHYTLMSVVWIVVNELAYIFAVQTEAISTIIHNGTGFIPSLPPVLSWLVLS